MTPAERFLRAEGLPLLKQVKQTWQSNGSKVRLGAGPRSSGADPGYVLQVYLQPFDVDDSFRMELIASNSPRISVKFAQFGKSQLQSLGADMEVSCDLEGSQAAIETFETIVADYRHRKAAGVLRKMKLPL